MATDRTTVVHVNDLAGYDIYVGRAVPRQGFDASPYGNPFIVGQPHPFTGERMTQLEAVALYDTAIDGPRDQFEALANRLHAMREEGTWKGPKLTALRIFVIEHRLELTGKRIGCWCADRPVLSASGLTHRAPRVLTAEEPVPHVCHGQVLAREADRPPT